MNQLKIFVLLTLLAFASTDQEMHAEPESPEPVFESYVYHLNEKNLEQTTDEYME